VSTTALDLPIALPAPSTQAWLDTHLRARFDDWEEEAELTGPAEVIGITDLHADDGARLRAAHDRLVVEGTPPPAAATYLADWYAGAIAGAVGYGLATAGAGFLATPTPDAEVQLHLHPDGWPFRVELPGHVLVLPDHPWAGDDSSQTVGDVHQLLRRTVHELVEAVRPIIDACHRLARVGAAGLWNEVADSLGKAVAFQHLVPPTPTMLAVLDAAVSLDGVPWKARPRLGFAISPVLGAVHVAQKGGCCLAYTAPEEEPPDPDDPGLAPYHRAYLARFPVDAAAPRYCSTCSFRDSADTDARQVFWHEHHAPAGGI